MEGASTGIHLAGEHELAQVSATAAADMAWIALQLRACAAHLPVAVARASIQVVGDDRMRQLHARHSGLDTTTDVLTFSASAPGQPIECDIAICAHEAARRGAELGHTAAQELLLYALHGLLHACGMDDQTPAAHAAMHAEEDRILTAVGVGPLFGAGVRRAPGTGVEEGRA